ncbi:MAG: COX15/CtaA family protein [Sediminibacterium sp.]|jgi:cytochrome c oxidase assembly protein subunit 15|nr:COX15/CtaA family protein [Sediminibacterium sp.]
MNTANRSNKLVATWLLLGVVMTIIQFVLGGVTRLTGSGLSITEWEVITGALPPLSEEAWLIEFAKYKQTPQFQLLNFEFDLQNFKYIFFWEWFHRLWARIIGLVFAGGFIWFLVAKHFKKEMIKPLVILFFLGIMQGAIGWIMVASGLEGDAVYVKPTRLALHFIFALGLLSYTFWFALQLSVPKTALQISAGMHEAVQKAKTLNVAILALLVLQLMYGALMAGHKAAMVAPTWPTINGDYVPTNLFSDPVFLLNFIENKILVHFMHRGIAYVLLALVIYWTVKLYQINGSSFFNRIKIFPLLLVVLQVLLGIASLLYARSIIPGVWGIFEWMAQIHQLVGMSLLLSLVATYYVMRAQTK